MNNTILTFLCEKCNIVFNKPIGECGRGGYGTNNNRIYYSYYCPNCLIWTDNVIGSGGTTNINSEFTVNVDRAEGRGGNGKPIIYKR